MNIAPIAIVMPVPFHAPNAEAVTLPCASCPSGSSGKRCASGTSPVTNGTMPTIRSGVSDAMPRMRCVFAAFDAPLCCSRNVMSRSAAASRNVVLMRSVRPALMNDRSAIVRCHVLIAASAGKSADSA
jgi:hypothetical protein